MFTGIVEETGKIIAAHELAGTQGGAELTVAPSRRDFLADVSVGDSISVDGACLTVTGIEGGAFRADTMPVTLERTTLGGLRAGSTVNLEKAMAAGDRFGGHFVTGHVDEVGRIRSIRPSDNAVLVEIEAPESFTGLLIDRGSVAVDGISLTVAYLEQDHFTVSIIPRTAEVTTLVSKAAGAPVNLEADMIAKYVKRFVERPDAPELSRESLERHGFL